MFSRLRSLELALPPCTYTKAQAKSVMIACIALICSACSSIDESILSSSESAQSTATSLQTIHFQSAPSYDTAEASLFSKPNKVDTENTGIAETTGMSAAPLLYDDDLLGDSVLNNGQSNAQGKPSEEGFFASLVSGSFFKIEPWVKPFERSNLADPIMSMNRNPISISFGKHVNESREGARGADGGAGGGCGCN